MERVRFERRSSYEKTTAPEPLANELHPGCDTLLRLFAAIQSVPAVVVFDPVMFALRGNGFAVHCASVEALRLALVYAGAQSHAFGSVRGQFCLRLCGQACTLIYDYSAQPPGIVILPGGTDVEIDTRLLDFSHTNDGE